MAWYGTAAVQSRRHRDGGTFRIPVAAAVAVDPTDGDVARVTATRSWTPDERLRFAVLMQALVELRRYPPGSRYALAARAWIDDPDLSWPLSFLAICDVLGLDAGAVRRRAIAGLTAVRGRPWLHAGVR